MLSLRILFNSFQLKEIKKTDKQKCSSKKNYVERETKFLMEYIFSKV